MGVARLSSFSGCRGKNAVLLSWHPGQVHKGLPVLLFLWLLEHPLAQLCDVKFRVSWAVAAATEPR